MHREVSVTDWKEGCYGGLRITGRVFEMFLAEAVLDIIIPLSSVGACKFSRISHQRQSSNMHDDLPPTNFKEGCYGGLRRTGRVFEMFLIQQHKFFVIVCDLLRTEYRGELGISMRRSDTGIKNCALHC